MNVKRLPCVLVMAAMVGLAGILVTACAGSSSDPTETIGAVVTTSKAVEAPAAAKAGTSIASVMALSPAVKNLCASQAANSFHCIDDTSFQLCTGNDNFVVNSCPKGFCATRHPANKNPCIGAARARQIDGVEPTPPGT